MVESTKSRHLYLGFSIEWTSLRRNIYSEDNLSLLLNYFTTFKFFIYQIGWYSITNCSDLHGAHIILSYCIWTQERWLFISNQFTEVTAHSSSLFYGLGQNPCDVGTVGLDITQYEKEHKNFLLLSAGRLLKTFCLQQSECPFSKMTWDLEKGMREAHAWSY